MRRRYTTAILPVLAASLLLPAVSAAGSFPGDTPDRRIIETQEKVDRLFEKGDYERAYFIYHEELAPLGDKYAHYMIGYMHLAGKSVPADAITASAWYRLAAERGNASFAQVRDELWKALSENERQRSDRKYEELRLRYSDAVIVARLLDEDSEYLRNWSANPGLQTDLVDSGAANSRAQSLRNLEKTLERMRVRLAFLADALSKNDSMSDAETRRIRDAQRDAKAAISSIR